MKPAAGAVRYLKEADPILGRAIESVGPYRLKRQPNQFGALVEAILYQQLALNAAATIARRFRRLYANPGRLPRPEELRRTPARKLRAAGISRQKIGYLRDLARKAASGRLRLGRFRGMSDEEVIANLIQVKGIGRWTAEMFLLFSLGRPDVLPLDDLGLRYAVKQAYRLRTLPSATKMERIAAPWRPYRSAATWYLWKFRRLPERSRG
ncbi:MAG: DNA-3-methyladenine glycosylase 2 family protein [Acidobacteria bacterium]|nr:DNA-3-methyladenine glycosylase 2 family protein [Acidobacteriota bacterium]